MVNYYFLSSGFLLRTEWVLPFLGRAGVWLASDVEIFQGFWKKVRDVFI